jgi:hypothetical protein
MMQFIANTISLPPSPPPSSFSQGSSSNTRPLSADPLLDSIHHFMRQLHGGRRGGGVKDRASNVTDHAYRDGQVSEVGRRGDASSPLSRSDDFSPLRGHSVLSLEPLLLCTSWDDRLTLFGITVSRLYSPPSSPPLQMMFNSSSDVWKARRHR